VGKRNQIATCISQHAELEEKRSFLNPFFMLWRPTKMPSWKIIQWGAFLFPSVHLPESFFVLLVVLCSKYTLVFSDCNLVCKQYENHFFFFSFLTFSGIPFSIPLLTDLLSPDRW
jgi:hypothetical protein